MSDDISHAIVAKSDQLNALDILGNDLTIRIRDVKVTKTADQPVWVYFDGDNNRPWKPSKGMLRVLGAAWGLKSKAWIGRHAQLFCNPDVKYAGKAVGGIQIRALSDIERDLHLTIAINRSQREPFIVKKLTITESMYPVEQFNKALPKMIAMMQDGTMTLQQVIARCQQTGKLTPEQLAELEKNAPIDIDETSELGG